MAKQRAKIDGNDLFGKTEKGQDDKASSSQDDKPKKKLTLYITDDTAMQLDMAWMKIRHATGESLSRSDIIEAAILAALDDDDYSKIIDILASNS